MLWTSDSQGCPPSTFLSHSQDSRTPWKPCLVGEGGWAGLDTARAWRKHRDPSAPEESLMAV